MRLFKTAFVVSVITFLLALCVFAWLFTLPKNAPGEGGYVIIAFVMSGIYTFSTLAFISLLAAAVSSFAFRSARWFLVPTILLAAVGGWMLAHSEVKALVDTVGPGDIPRLICSLQTDLGSAWETDVSLLAHLGADAAPSLIQALRSDDPRTRFGAATALRDMSFRAKGVIPDLVSALKHSDPKVRMMVAAALGTACRENADDEIAIPGLCESLHDEDVEVRRKAMGALKWMTVWGNGPLEAVPRALINAIPSVAKALGGDDDELVRMWAAEILGRMGSLANSALPSLRKAVDDPSKSVRSQVAEAIKKILDSGQIPARN